MKQLVVIAFLLDNNCPESIFLFLEARGHDVVRVRDIMPSNSPDPVVAEAAMQTDRILVGWDKDFNHQRFLKPRHKSLSRIGFSCSEVDGLARLTKLIDDVEREAAKRTGQAPMIFRIGKDKFQISR